ncbi:carcinoembryonic antigen-related cell adhesion molecule 8-like [Ahaetulla prasina]|uniref:carcinoembryonic antigen-related cell adhesion molecule 8-like n=1 Tax=Ahaetulla prasina TaxID=499056 RepID=UPI00264767A2|nr:carcinoembryonic antigen-related cell adhesion molecule 8-like [Ahaetulla prasina]
MNPSNAIEGQGINLTVGSAPTAFFICNWYRGGDSQKNLIVTIYLLPLSGYVFGPAYTGRETPGPNCSLHLENLNQDDSGIYTVTEDGPSVHGKGELSVEVLAPGLLPKPSMSIVQLFRENMDSVHLKCDTTVRFANISWLQNGKPLNSCPRIQLSNNNQTLTIQPVLRHDSAAYQCHISNPLSAQRSDAATISVIYGPDPPVIKITAKFLTQPSSQRLNCKARSFPEAEYRWFHNGKEFSKKAEVLLKNIHFHMAQAEETIPIKAVPPNPMETQEVLLIPPVPPDDTFLCNWIRQLTETEEFVREPNVIITPAPFLMEFQSIQLRCNTSITQDVSWFKDGDSLGNGQNLTDSNRVLSIASLKRTDTGKYQCQVFNGITTVKSEPEYLSVIYGPEVPVITPNKACHEEDVNIKLTCRAASWPEPQYTWYRDNVLIDFGPKLFIENFNESQAGIYICEAMNDLLQKQSRSNSQHIHLKKSCVSEVTVDGPLEGTEDQSTSLTCTAQGDNVTYFWTKDNRTVNGNGRIILTENGQNLTFNPSHRTDAARYTCHAHNSYSSSQSDPVALSIICESDLLILDHAM